MIENLLCLVLILRSSFENGQDPHGRRMRVSLIIGLDQTSYDMR